jgi:signal transduction histidine kinase
MNQHKLHVFVLFLCLISVGSIAQNRLVIDSLKTKLLSADERSQFNVLCSIGFEYRYSFPDSTIFYCNKAFELGTAIGLKKNLSKPLSFLGLAYTNRGDFKTSLEFHERAIQVATDQQDSLQLGHSYNNLGRMFFDAGDWVRAFSNFLSSKQIFESLNDKSGMAYVYRSLASIYQTQGDFAKAIEMSEKAYQIRKEIGDKRGIISSLIEFGLLYESNNDTKYALEKFNQADALAHEIDDKVTTAELSMAIAEIQVQEGQFEQALQNAEDVLNTISESTNQKLYVRASLAKSKIFIHDKQFVKAITVLEEVLIDSRSSGNLIYELEALKLLTTCHEALSHFDKAQHYRNDFALLEQKIKNTDLLREIDRLQFQLMIEKVETENKSLRTTQLNNESLISRQRFQNIILIIAVFSFLVISSVLFIYSRKRRKINLKLSEQNGKILNQQKAISETNEMLTVRNQELNQLNAEKDSLMSIVAHDLKSPLNRIAGLARLLEMEGGLTQQQAEYLGMIMMATKSGSDLITDLLDVTYLNESIIPACTEIDLNMLLKNRIKSYKVSADFKSIQIDFSYTSHSLFHSVPDYINRIVDNLLSNAIKFSDRHTKIEVVALIEPDNAIISIRDSGPGFSDDDKQHLFQRFKRLSARPTGGESSNGLGLAIVKTLVDRLHGKIELKSVAGQGAEFIVTIPSAIPS